MLAAATQQGHQHPIVVVLPDKLASVAGRRLGLTAQSTSKCHRRRSDGYGAAELHDYEILLYAAARLWDTIGVLSEGYYA